MYFHDFRFSYPPRNDMQYVWPYMLDTYEKDIKFLKVSKAFISAETEVVCAQGWACIPTFYFTFLANKIIIRSIYFRRFLCHFYQKIGQDCQSV